MIELLRKIQGELLEQINGGGDWADIERLDRLWLAIQNFLDGAA